MRFKVESILYEWNSDCEDVELYKELLLRLPFISYNKDTNEMIGIINTIEDLEKIDNIAKVVSSHSKENCIFTYPDLLVDFRDSTVYIRDFYTE